MYFLILDELTSAFWDGVRTMFYSLDTIIYKLIIYLYNLFDMLCSGRILDSEFVQDISFRAGLILGLTMFFRVVFSLIQMMVNPDTINDKEKGAFSLVKRCLVTIVLLGVMPSIFDLAYNIQDIMLGNNEQGVNIIGRFLLPTSIAVDSDRFGSVLSQNLLFSFYDINDSIDTENTEVKEVIDCSRYMEVLQNEIVNFESFSFGYNCLNTKIQGNSSISGFDETIYVVRYDILLSTVVGVMVCWLILSYCFSVGVRVVELAFLQIISPMAIVSYISPKKDGMFQKWTKLCFTTYLDMFVRVAIINFVVLLISMIMESMDGGDYNLFWITTGAYSRGIWYRRFLKVIMILSLLQFAKKVPQLLKELFPNSTGRYGFGLKDREYLGKGLATVGGVATGGAVGLLTGALGGKGFSRVTGAFSGLIGGAGRGMIAGVKSKGGSVGDITKVASDVRKSQLAAGSKRAHRIYGGTTVFESFEDSFYGSVGAMTPYQKLEGEYSSYKSIKAEIDDDEGVKAAEYARTEAYNKYRLNGGTLLFEDWKKDKGKSFEDAVNETRTKAFQEAYNNSNSAFRVMVDKHNKRFGTHFDGTTKWTDFNDSRKEVKSKFEKLSARKSNK